MVAACTEEVKLPFRAAITCIVQVRLIISTICVPEMPEQKNKKIFHWISHCSHMHATLWISPNHSFSFLQRLTSVAQVVSLDSQSSNRGRQPLCIRVWSYETLCIVLCVAMLTTCCLTCALWKYTSLVCENILTILMFSKKNAVQCATVRSCFVIHLHMY